MNYNITKEIFEKRYDDFLNRLCFKGDGHFHKLITKKDNSEFGILRNNNSVFVKAITEKETEMTISKKQLVDVLFNNKEYLYSSYEPVIIDYIINDKLNDLSELCEYYDYYKDLNKKKTIFEKRNNILSTKNIMLYGAPGVGKTHNYKRLITMIEDGNDEKTIFDTISKNETTKNETTNDFDNSIFENIKKEKRIEFVTFHQSYSYEDFIEGFRPQKNGIIDREDGIFKTLCEEADKNPSKNFYIVIDEINRGNISKIFGEIITLIEEDKRDDYEVTLPYSKEKFKIPSNLYIIATMNSTDKSIATIDIALRRRFTFLKMKPKEELVKNEKAKDLMEKLNNHIKETISEDYQLGHSYFMKIENDEDLSFVKKYKIQPLLEEYFYGDEENYEKALEFLGLKDEPTKQ